jgi:hypothetical protein
MDTYQLIVTRHTCDAERGRAAAELTQTDITRDSTATIDMPK